MCGRERGGGGGGREWTMLCENDKMTLVMLTCSFCGFEARSRNIE